MRQRRDIARRHLAFVRSMAKRGVRIASVCSGAYILAEAGLLDGRRATTHWQRTRHFLATYPKVKLEPDRIFTRDGNIWTSAGITAGIDLSLAMVAEDYGEEIAQKTARQLGALPSPQRRPVAILLASGIESAERPLRPLLAWAREHLEAPLTVEDMAEQAGMSARHFTRAFIAETGYHAIEGGRAVTDRGGATTRAILQRSDRARRGTDRLPRSGADAPRLHPRLRPAAAIAPPRGAGGLVQRLQPGADVARGDIGLLQNLPMVKKPWNWPGKCL